MTFCSGIVRKIIRFPFVAEGSGTWVATAIPGPPVNGTAGFMQSTTWSMTDPSGGTLEQCVQKVNLPRRRGLRAISVAPDSAISSCDISFGSVGDDSQRQRVAVGQPLIGGVDEAHDFILVSVPMSFPLIGALPTSASPSFAFDGMPTQAGAGQPPAWAWPLRLNFWYGDALPVHGDKRSPYHGRVIFNLAAVVASCNAYFCVDGRKFVSVIAYAESATFTVSIDEVVPIAAGPATPLSDGFVLVNRVPIQTPGATTANRFDLQPISKAVGAPAANTAIPAPMPSFHILRAHCGDTAGNNVRNAIDVYAWD